MENLFGTDGIRGVANTYPMDIETAATLGKAVAGYFGKSSGNSARHIVIGQDTRLSGDMLAQAVAAGACAAGVDVWMLGVLPTPGIAYMTAATQAVAGIVISASHNPYEDNGIKLFDKDGYKLPDPIETQIEAYLKGELPITLAPSKDIGRLKNVEDANDQYVKFLLRSIIRPPGSKLTIVLDCANGATFKVAPELFHRLGNKVFTLSCNPNGRNINADCGSQHPQHLAQAVLEHQADLGLAFDGDGDRLIAVDEKGRILSGDQIVAILAKALKQMGRLKNNTVVSTVMSNLGLRTALQQMGIQHISTQVGDRHVMQAMLEKDAVLGGEDSGHIILRNVHTTGDGLLAALGLIESLTASTQPVSVLAKVMTVFPQVLINVEVKEKPGLENLPTIVNVIRQAEERLGGQGRVLVRYSGTQNICRVMVEGPTQDITDSLCEEIASEVRNKLS